MCPVGARAGGGAGAGRGEWRGTYVNCSGAGLTNHHDPVEKHSHVRKMYVVQLPVRTSDGAHFSDLRPTTGPRVRRAGLRHALSALGSRHVNSAAE